MAAEHATSVTIQSLLDSGAIVGHKDGNYGSLYPRAEDFGSVGIPFLTAKSLNNGTIDIEGAPRLADDKASALQFGFLKPGDVLLSHNATIGRVAVVPEFDGQVLIGTSLTYFRVDPSKISPRYLAAYLSGRAFQEELAAVMSHSTRNQVPITAQRRLRVALPSLPTQRAIAEVLGTLDEKIQSNRQMSRTLEAIARAIFKSWFVDFDPVRAKRDGKGGGLGTDYAKLFPASLERTDVGAVPQGWTTGSLGDLCNRIVDKVEEPRDWLDEPLIDLSRMPQRSVALDEWGRGEELTTSVTRFARRDTLFGAIRPYFHKVGLAPLDGVTNVSVLVLRANEPDDWAFLVMLCSSDELVAYATRVSRGTKMPVVTASDLMRYSVSLPPAQVRAAFGRVVGPMLDRIVQQVYESHTLAALRDALLPRLVSGELRLKQVGQVIEKSI